MSEFYKKNKKLIIGVILVMVAGIVLVVSLEVGYFGKYYMWPSDFEYEVISEEDKTCCLTKYNGSKVATLNIPDMVDGYTVVELGEALFWRCPDLVGNIDIPDSVKVIRQSAFSECEGLTGKIKLPEELEQIHKDAFCGCTGLVGDLDIPDSVTLIGPWAFCGCSGLNGKLTLPEGDEITHLFSGAFVGCDFSGVVVIPLNVDICAKVEEIFDVEDFVTIMFEPNNTPKE